MSKTKNGHVRDPQIDALVEESFEKARSIAGELKPWLEHKTEGDTHVALTALMLVLAFLLKITKMPPKNRKEMFAAVELTVQQPFDELDEDVYNLGHGQPFEEGSEKAQFEEAAERLNLTKPNKKETIH
jgi:hypothetical protein